MVETLLDVARAILDILNQYSNVVIAFFTAFTVIIAIFELSQRLKGPDIRLLSYSPRSDY